MVAYIRATCDDCEHDFNATTTAGTLAQVATRLATGATCPKCRSGRTRIASGADASGLAPIDDLVDGIVDKIFAYLETDEAKRAGKTQAGFGRCIDLHRAQITRLKRKERRISLDEIRHAEDYLQINLLPPALRRLADGTTQPGAAA